MDPPALSVKKLMEEPETESELDEDADEAITPPSNSCREGLTFKLSKDVKGSFKENDEEQLKKDLIAVQYALDLFLNSQFLQSESFLRKRFGVSLWVFFKAYCVVYFWIRNS
jgi:hypothetical protein